MRERLPEYQPPIRIDGESRDPVERFHEHEAEFLEHFQGEWIAIAEDGWFAHSLDAEELAQQIERENRDDIFVIGMPTLDTPAPFYGSAILV